MTSSRRTRVSIALVAFALATLSLPAKAQSWMPSGPLDTPNFIESWDGDAEKALPDVSAKPEQDQAVRVKNHRGDPEAPAEAVTVVQSSTTRSERPKQWRQLPSIVNQYEQNPRCYVAGQYVPAPPLCPN
jgi:hypothetical protein